MIDRVDRLQGFKNVIADRLNVTYKQAEWSIVLAELIRQLDNPLTLLGNYVAYLLSSATPIVLAGRPKYCSSSRKRAWSTTETAALQLFDRYLSRHHVASWESIDSSLIDDFLKSRPSTRPRSYNHLVGVIHRFFAWAVIQELARWNPVIAKPRRILSADAREKS